MTLKYILILATFISLALSGNALAKKYDHKNDSDHDRSEARWENSNRQSDEYSEKGGDQAEKRHYLKDSKGKKEKGHHDDWYESNHNRYEQRGDDDDRDKRKHDRYKYQHNDDRHDEKRDRYEKQRYEERYRNNPIGTVIDQNVNNAKSKIDDIHHRAIDTIDNKSRNLTDVVPQRDQSSPNNRWWWPFPE